MQRWLLAALTVVMTTAPTASFGRPPHPPGGGPPGPGQGPGLGPRELDALSLSAEQESQIEDLRASMDIDTKQARTELRQLHEELEELWKSDVLDEESIVAKVRAIAESRRVMDEAHARMKVRSMAVLSAEQRAELARLVAEHRDERPRPPRPRFDRAEDRGQPGRGRQEF